MSYRFSRRNCLDRVFSPDLGREPGSDASDEGLFAPATDVTVTATAYEVRLELPGVDPAEVDISVAVDSRTVEIRGNKRSPVLDSAAKYLNIEIQYGVFARIVALPERVDGDRATATYRDGFLVVRLPKLAAPNAGRRIPIESA